MQCCFSLSLCCAKVNICPINSNILCFIWMRESVVVSGPNDLSTLAPSADMPYRLHALCWYSSCVVYGRSLEHLWSSLCAVKAIFTSHTTLTWLGIFPTNMVIIDQFSRREANKGIKVIRWTPLHLNSTSQSFDLQYIKTNTTLRSCWD